MTNNNDIRTSDLFIVCGGTNAACEAARNEGRPIHAHPMLSESPRLILPSYHFASVEDARNAIDEARANAPIVRSDDDLYAYRAQGIAHRIPKGWVDPSRR